MPFDTLIKVPLIVDCDEKRRSNSDTRKEVRGEEVEGNNRFNLQVIITVTIFMTLISIVPSTDCTEMYSNYNLDDQLINVLIHPHPSSVIKWYFFKIYGRNKLGMVEITNATMSPKLDHRRVRFLVTSGHLIIMRRDHSHGLVCVTKENLIKVRRRTPKHLKSQFCRWRAEDVSLRRHRRKKRHHRTKKKRTVPLVAAQFHRFQNIKSMAFFTVGRSGSVRMEQKRSKANLFTLLPSKAST